MAIIFAAGELPFLYTVKTEKLNWIAFLFMG